MWKHELNQNKSCTLWGPKRLTTTIEKMDVIPGDVWRFVQRDPDGMSTPSTVCFERSCHQRGWFDTFEFEVMQGHVMLETATFLS